MIFRGIGKKIRIALAKKGLNGKAAASQLGISETRLSQIRVREDIKKIEELVDLGNMIGEPSWKLLKDATDSGSEE